MMRTLWQPIGMAGATVAILLLAGPASARTDKVLDDSTADLVRFRADGKVQMFDGTLVDIEDYKGPVRAPVIYTEPRGGDAQTSSIRHRTANQGPISRISEGLTIPGLTINPTGTSRSIVGVNGPRFTSDGRYIVFESRANFVDEDVNDLPDIYRYDTHTGEIILVSKTFGLTGVPDNSIAFNSNPNFRVGAFSPAISDDGKKIAFYSALILTDLHADFEWSTWRFDPQDEVVPGAPANADEVLRASDDVWVYWIELDDDGDIIDLQIASPPGDALPFFSPGAGVIQGLDMTPDGEAIVFVAGNGNVSFDATPPNPNITIEEDDLVWIWDRTSNEARLLTRNGVLGPGAFLGMFVIPTFGPPRIGGNGGFVTFTSILWGNENISGTVVQGTAQMEIFGCDISNPQNPGPILRVSTPNSSIVNTTNNTAANGGVLARIESPPVGGTGRNENARTHPTNPNLIAFLSNNSPHGSVNAGPGILPFANGGTGLNTQALYVKNRSTGELVNVVRNESADGGSATWNFGTLGGTTQINNTLLSWSKDGNWIGFTADWDILTDGLNAPPGFGFTDGFIPYAIEYPVVGTPNIVALTNTGDAVFAPGISGNKTAFELGATVDQAVFVVEDGVTFPGTSTLFPVVAIYDGTEPAGSRLSRLDFGPAIAPNTNDLSGRPAVSEDGSVFAYVSFAANIVDDDVNGFPDVFVYDANTDTHTLVSRNHTTMAVGNSASGASRDLNNILHQVAMTGNARQWNAISPIDISADGRYVVFPSHSTNIGAVGVNKTAAEVTTALSADPPNLGLNAQIYRYDRDTNQILLVSDSAFDAGGNSGYFIADGYCFAPSVSADGRYVVFQSTAENLGGFYLDPEDAGAKNIFLRDLTIEAGEAGAMTLISDKRDADGIRTDFLAIEENSHPKISADGERIVWSSRDNLFSILASPPAYRIYRWDRLNDEVNLIAPGDRFGMSRNGEHVVINTLSPLLPEDPDFDAGINFRDMYVWNETDGLSYLNLGPDLDGFRWSFVQNWPTISNDGNYVAFWSQARFDPAKTNNRYSLYVHNRDTGNNTLVSKNAANENADSDVLAFGDTIIPQFSWPAIANELPVVEATSASRSIAERIGIAFDLQASNLVPDDVNGHRDVFYRVLDFGDAPPPIPGDINNDGVVNVQDVTFLGNVVNGLATLPPGVNGDINGDGETDMADVEALALQIVN